MPEAPKGTPGAGPRVRRIRFSGAQQIPGVPGRVRVRVKLEAPGRRDLVGTAEGPASLEGELRAAADAAVAALRQATSDQKVTIELREVAAFDAFGKPGVMVSLRGTYQNADRPLLGFSALEKDHARSTVKAVLSATNRFIAAVT